MHHRALDIIESPALPGDWMKVHGAADVGPTDAVDSSGVVSPTSVNEPTLIGAPRAVFEAVSAFYTYDSAAPLDAEVFAIREDASASEPAVKEFARERIVFSGIGRIRVPGYLAFPKSRPGRVPVVVLIDGIYGSKDRWFEKDSWPRGAEVSHALLDAGIAVLALDVRSHGERAAENWYRPPVLEDAAFRDMVVPSIIEHRRAMDYLATRPEIDASRIGMLGLSMGGMMTLALAAMDRRVKGAVVGVVPAGMFKGPGSVPVAPQTFTPAISNIPVLMLMGRDDEVCGEADAERLFDSIASTTKELVWYDSGHRLPAAYPARAVEWLVRCLSPSGPSETV